ncbi:hypothetical protein F7725_021958 [Dissostichus mawsoni]|uniref:Uncharacterized protein n=1 Tax=Dissostichus mawsoni TaxID=36200 RepID=A0A7J5ZEW0_DISMA|nr:hypothetical protein F7725_021958 [Dissostichus mawsoni]
MQRWRKRKRWGKKGAPAGRRMMKNKANARAAATGKRRISLLLLQGSVDGGKDKGPNDRGLMVSDCDRHPPRWSTEATLLTQTLSPDCHQSLGCPSCNQQHPHHPHIPPPLPHPPSVYTCSLGTLKQSQMGPLFPQQAVDGTWEEGQSHNTCGALFYFAAKAKAKAKSPGFL